ncbi:YbgC/FadM family acyl-CoA thioesterase [Sphingomonas sp. BAUL-RG-20F-R05-02]|uniref:YbgC/FadM family acyl-CoA thioesterase n=1 Tax=Sphingomonas sp. BAUL-RG-20F-R05-02 TaxID=2914830 RepID=UPI001F59C19C|nr:YbgC/FadM family acyl-CoA thioesterase [Sphingomonas sp. BAUL-RG-20F-R05-02]
MPARDTDLPTEGRIVGDEHQLPVRVYFEDTDLSGMVYHANYLKFMERGRSDMLRVLGIDQQAAHAGGEGNYVVTDLAIRYRAPARLGDAVVVTTRLEKLGAARLVIQQRVRRGAVVLAEGHVTVAFAAPSGRARRQPAAWIEAFGRFLPERAAQPETNQGERPA